MAFIDCPAKRIKKEKYFFFSFNQWSNLVCAIYGSLMIIWKLSLESIYVIRSLSNTEFFLYDIASYCHFDSRNTRSWSTFQTFPAFDFTRASSVILSVNRYKIFSQAADKICRKTPHWGKPIGLMCYWLIRCDFRWIIEIN